MECKQGFLFWSSYLNKTNGFFKCNVVVFLFKLIPDSKLLSAVIEAVFAA